MRGAAVACAVLGALACAAVPVRANQAPGARAAVAEADLGQRRARAADFASDRGPAPTAEVLAALAADPDPLVRRAGVRAAGRVDLGRAGLEARVEHLARAARTDLVAEVRSDALAALGALGGPAVGGALLELMGELAGDDLRAAAEALAAAEGAGPFLARALGAAGPVDRSTTARRLPPSALAPLLEAYGEALPDLPRGGADPRARAPLVLAARHPDEEVRRSAVTGLDRAMGRYDLAGWPPAADAFLDGLAADGYDTRGLDYRRALLALSAGSSPERAFAPAARLVQRSTGGEHYDDRMWTFYGHYLEALAKLGVRDLSAVEPALDRAGQVLAGLRGRRLELRERADSPRAGLDAAAAADLIELQAAVEWLRLVNLAAQGDGASAAGEAARTAARLHGLLLDAERIQLGFELSLTAASLDAVLDRDLSVRRVLVANPELPDWSTGELIDLLLTAAGWLAAAAPGELPGIEPLGDDGEPGWRADAARRARMLALRHAELELVARRMAIDRTNRRLWIFREERLLERLAVEPDQALDFAFEDYRRPSTIALDLARDLRADGDAGAALELARRLRDELDGADLGFGPVRSDQVAALVGREIGACLTDLDRPLEAETELTAALERIEAVENSVADRIESLAQGRDGARVLVEPEPDLVRALERQVEGLRSLRADLLVALAVNANVRLDAPERAVEFFERAYELQQTSFMRVLLACYRARVGRAAEARFLLDGIAPAPELYYNLACTHALLGDRDVAIDYLTRELGSTRLTAGALARQRAWAAGDPDLASLRGDPAFEALVAER